MHSLAAMAARATRSASRKARLTEAVATGPLGALSHDELGVIFDGLADPLQPFVAVALSSTCLGLRTPLRPALEVLKERRERAVALCRKVGWGNMELRDAQQLNWLNIGLTADDMASLAMILRTSGLPRLQYLHLYSNRFGDAGVQALCEGLGTGAAPSLLVLSLSNNQFGPVGAEALAAALSRGALPKLATLGLGNNPIGNQGVAALTAPLRSRPAFKQLVLNMCEIGDEGVASLVDNLGKEDFKALKHLHLDSNAITDAGCATLSRALDAGAFPALDRLRMQGLGDRLRMLPNPASEAAQQTVQDALSRAAARR